MCRNGSVWLKMIEQVICYLCLLFFILTLTFRAFSRRFCPKRLTIITFVPRKNPQHITVDKVKKRTFQHLIWASELLFIVGGGIMLCGVKAKSEQMSLESFVFGWEFVPPLRRQNRENSQLRTATFICSQWWRYPRPADVVDHHRMIKSYRWALLSAYGPVDSIVVSLVHLDLWQWVMWLVSSLASLFLYLLCRQTPRNLTAWQALRISVSVISYVHTNIKTDPTPLDVQGKQTGEEHGKLGLAN